jgi:hypothetical protein
MKLSIGFLALAALVVAGVGLNAWMGHISHRDNGLRPIHYDTNYDLSAQRRIPAE